MRLAVSWRKSSQRSAMPPAFSILPTSCRESAGRHNCQDREGELDVCIGSLATQRLSGSGVKCAVV